MECISSVAMERPFQHALARLRLLAPENIYVHHKLPAEPNCSHSTRQSIHSRQLKSNFHSIRLAPDCELGERGRRATFSWPKPHATEAERPCA